MKSNNEQSYYSKIFPQSTYRSDKDSETNIEHAKPINLELINLEISDPQTKELLKQKIKTVDANILQLLLPEKELQTAIEDGHLDYIFSELGL